MIYGELFIPNVAQGLMLRFGRYISLPDIEAQLAPNNYMYTHSMTYAFDNYTNEGLQASLAVTPHIILQLGVSVGTETTITNLGKTIPNPAPGNVLYGGANLWKDPGAQYPTLTACARFEWNEGKDNLQPCMNGINNGAGGYNNLQWYRFTYYHKFNDHWHISFLVLAAGRDPARDWLLPFEWRECVQRRHQELRLDRRKGHHSALLECRTTI
jgi:hypothetical protein